MTTALSPGADNRQVPQILEELLPFKGKGALRGLSRRADNALRYLEAEMHALAAESQRFHSAPYYLAVTQPAIDASLLRWRPRGSAQWLRNDDAPCALAEVHARPIREYLLRAHRHALVLNAAHRMLRGQRRECDELISLLQATQQKEGQP